MIRRRMTLIPLLGSLVGLFLAATPARAETCGSDVLTTTCGKTDDAVQFSGKRLGRDEVRSLPKWRGDKGAAVTIRPDNAPTYEYRTLIACNQSVPDTATEEATCASAYAECPPDEQGPLSTIWRRVTLDGKVIAGWARVGNTCFTDVAPGARPTLTMAQIREQYMRTPWAKARLQIQPQGNVTLVNLKTFYGTQWSDIGFGPGEVDSSSILGFEVRIRPKLVGYTYTFGDGSTFGPTDSPGGMYPDGDVTHQYTAPGVYSARVTTTFAADFSINGSDWLPIPGADVSVQGPATQITVKEAKAQLTKR